LSGTTLVNIFSGAIYLSQEPLKQKNVFRSGCISIAIVGKTVSKSGCNTATTIEIKFTRGLQNIFSRAVLLLQPSLIIPFWIS